MVKSQIARQSKRWCFTVNNMEVDNLCTAHFHPDIDYMIQGDEVAPTTQTPHVQGYVIFTTNKRLAAVKKLLPTAHWEIAKGTTAQNIEYCSKDGESYIFDYRGIQKYRDPAYD